MSGLRKILWQRLNTDLTASLGPDWVEKKLVLYGAGGLGLSFMQTFPQLSFAYAMDSNRERVGERFHGLRIEAPEIVQDENFDDLIVFITSSWHEEIRQTLESFGMEVGRHFFFGNQQAHGRIFFYLDDKANFSRAFAWFEERGTVYSILRWFETLPKQTPAEIYLLMRTADLEHLFENPYLKGDPGGVPLEVYWDRPLGQEDELLYFPTWLAGEILSSRSKHSKGVYVPSEAVYLRSLVYQVVFHKAERAGLPPDSDKTRDPIQLPNKYFEKITELAGRAGVRPVFTLDGMWDYLESVDWLPPIDLARRYATSLQSPWLMKKVGAIPGSAENVLVFVLREWLLRNSELLAHVLDEIGAFGLEQVDCVELTEPEKAKAYEQIRGGNWVETEESRIGGGPAAFAVFTDPTPVSPSDQDRLLRPFCANRRLGGKTDLKQRICRAHNQGVIVNFLHAADDEREGMEYLECLAPERLEKLLAAIEEMRSPHRTKPLRGRSAGGPAA